MKKDTFKFVVTKALREPGADKCFQRVAVYATYPTFCYPIAVADERYGAEDWQINAAIEALKLSLIKEIVNAKRVTETEI